MRAENKKMQEFLQINGIKAKSKYIWTGSLKKTWKIYNLKIKFWGNKDLQNKLTSLGFKDFDGKELSDLSGNGGLFHIFSRYCGNKTF